MKFGGETWKFTICNHSEIPFSLNNIQVWEVFTNINREKMLVISAMDWISFNTVQF